MTTSVRKVPAAATTETVPGGTADGVWGGGAPRDRYRYRYRGRYRGRYRARPRYRSSRTAPRVLLAAGVVLLLAGLVSACAKETHAIEDERRAFSLEHLDTDEPLVIEAHNSRVELLTDPALDGEVAVARWFRAEKVQGRTGISWSMTGDGRLELKAVCKGIITTCDARHVVTVPEGIAVRATSSNGSLEAAGFTDGLELSTSNGALTVTGCSGPLTLESDNGTITAEGVDSATVRASSRNGGIALSLSGAPAVVETDSVNGDTVIEVPGEARYDVRAHARNGDEQVSVERGGEEHVITAESTNGGITVRPRP
ncbi:DUF4097 family beta strand repeat-containing protein [Streptomyces sp. YIM 98790]|uniref:DUF4097 family beta strand repeat-containing protein n=1 Tax=Streptomyces sp. YIM 98790 TaxID=2689077 RepID=UPI001409113D|nr:DUF4097 family beta strand repeat-containing protein [Streptomyces sp. YIM 98790]